MATLTAEATLGTALSVECGHHLATYRSQKLHVTEFRKPVAVKRNSKTAEYETNQDIFDSTASSGMGAWESVLDYDQYNLNVTDKQPITLVGDVVIDDGNVIPQAGLSDSGRIGLVFDFTEYYQCTPAVTSGNIVVKYTASGNSILQVRSSTSGTGVTISDRLYVQATYVEDDYIEDITSNEYTTSLNSYTIDDGFVTVWFKGAGITISNITARISARGKARASITPVIKNTFTLYDEVVKDEEIDFRYERDTVISFDNIDLSSWPSTFYNEGFSIDSIVNFTGILDNNALQFPGYVNYVPPSVYASQKTISSSRSQATENENPLYTADEQSPTAQLQLNDNRTELLSNNMWQMPSSLPRGYIEWDTNLFSGFGSSISGATISVWWYGTTVPITFIHADDPAMWYIYGDDVEDPNFAAYTYNQFAPNDGPKNQLYHQGNRSIQVYTGGTAGLFQFMYSSNNTKAYGNTARNFAIARWNNPNDIVTEGWNNFQMSFTTGTTPTVKAYLNGVAGTTSAFNVSEVELLQQKDEAVTQQLSSDFGIIDGKTSIHATYFGAGRTATGWNLSASYPNQHGTARGENGAFFFLDNQYVDLDIQSNREIFRNLDGTPTFTPQLNGQTPKIFISGDDRTINNNGVRPDTMTNVKHQYLSNENIDTVVGGAPLTRIRTITPTTYENGEYGDYINTFNRDTFEADSTLPVVTYNRMTSDDFTARTRLTLTRMGVDLAYVYPALGTFENGFIKSKLLLNLNLTSGPVNTQANFSVAQPNIDMILGADVTLASNFDVDTTTGKIHIFRFDPLTFNTAFTSTQSGSRLITATIESGDLYMDDDYVVEGYYDKEGGLFGKFTLSQPIISYQITAPDITLNTAFTTQQTGRRLIGDANTITTPITTDFNTFGRIHIFRFDDKTLSAEFGTTATGKIFRFDPVTLASAFDIDVVGGIKNVRSGAITLATAFTQQTDGGVGINSGLIQLDTAFDTTQSGSMLRSDGDAITIDTSFNVRLVRGYVIIANAETLNTSLSLNETGKIHIFTFAPHTFATNLALNETGKIHVFTFAPHTFDTAFTFDTTTGTGKKIHLFRFVPRTFNISSAFNPNTGRIHLFNLPAIDLATPFTADFRGGIRQEAQPTLDTNITVDVFAPVPLAPITLDTSLTLSQPTVEIAKQSNKVFAPRQTRTRLARPHPRTVDAERLETVTSSAIDEWQDVDQWLDFDDFTSRHSISHRITVAQNRTVKADVSTRTMLVTQVDRDELADTLTATYTVNAETRSYMVKHQHSYNVHSRDRVYVIPLHTSDINRRFGEHPGHVVQADTETRRVLAERLT